MIYTVETFKPAFPQRGTYRRAHRGTFEENRDHLSPCMVRAVEVEAQSAREALRKAMRPGEHLTIGAKATGKE